jgi:hypothetical protein
VLENYFNIFNIREFGEFCIKITGKNHLKIYILVLLIYILDVFL